MIGGVAGALLGTILISHVSGSCANCDLTAGDFLKSGLVSVGLGGACGFLVGLCWPKYESDLKKSTPDSVQARLTSGSPRGPTGPHEVIARARSARSNPAAEPRHPVVSTGSRFAC
jgi:hypothetical protein